jgi:membrane protein required for colicin V production
VALLVRLGAKALEGVLQIAMLGWLNRLGGILFYGLLYFFIFSIILFYAQKLEFFKPETLQASATYPLIGPLGPWMVDGLGKLLPFFKDLFSQLEIFFSRLSG